MIILTHGCDRIHYMNRQASAGVFNSIQDSLSVIIHLNSTMDACRMLEIFHSQINTAAHSAQLGSTFYLAFLSPTISFQSLWKYSDQVYTCNQNVFYHHIHIIICFTDAGSQHLNGRSSLLDE